MRHGKKINPLGRKAAHRKAMLSNMACSLIEHKRIKTTVAKAKALRKFVEPLITKSKNDTTHSRRIVFSHLRQKQVVTELFGEVATKVAERQGGYTRIIRLGNRLGDNAQMCLIELVDYNAIYSNEKPKKSKSTRRSRGGSKKNANKTTDLETASENTLPTQDNQHAESVSDESTQATVVEQGTQEKASEKVDNSETPKQEDTQMTIEEKDDKPKDKPQKEESNESAEKKEDKSE